MNISRNASVARWASLLSVMSVETLDHEGQEVLARGVIVAYASAFARTVGPLTGAVLDPEEWAPADPTYAELHWTLIDSLRRRYALQNETDVPGDYGRRAGLRFLLEAPAATWQRISELAKAQIRADARAGRPVSTTRPTRRAPPPTPNSYTAGTGVGRR